jgi:hypothetical protein
MSKEIPKYRKLRGRGAGIVGVTQLWVGEDQLVAATSIFGVESYQRFFFKNIEALIAVKTRGRRNWNIVVTLLLLLLIGIAAAVLRTEANDRTSIMVGFGVVMVPLLIALIVNSWKGSTCSFWVQTAGGLEQLGAPVRLPAAQNAIDVLTPEIARAQMTPSPLKA